MNIRKRNQLKQILGDTFFPEDDDFMVRISTVSCLGRKGKLLSWGY